MLGMVYISALENRAIDGMGGRMNGIIITTRSSNNGNVLFLQIQIPGVVKLSLLTFQFWCDLESHSYGL
jgi:hypothetical protein